MAFKLFPYATTAGWKKWKQRVFSLADLAGADTQTLALPGAHDYVPFRSRLPAYPHHVADDGPAAFFKEVMAVRATRQDALPQLCGITGQDPSVSPAVQLDAIGDRLAKALTPATVPLDLSATPELWFTPVWHSIRIDLGLFIGAQIICGFPHTTVPWMAPSPRHVPRSFMDYPALRIRLPSVPDEHVAEYRIRQRVQAAYAGRQDKDFLAGDWRDICAAVLRDAGMDNDPGTLKDFNPAYLNAQAANGPDTVSIYPFHTAETFLTLQMQKTYAPETLDAYHAHSLISLGDCLRPETHPNWTGLTLPQ